MTTDIGGGTAVVEAGPGSALRTTAARGEAHQQDRVAGLDVLRGVAALSVVVYHYTTRYNEHFTHPAPPPFYWPYGYLGVQLFFMISGFVIFMTIDRARSVADFAVARFARVIPPFWLGIIVTTLVVRAFAFPDGTHGPGTRDVLWNFSLLKTMSANQVVDGVYWTLYCEALFYIQMGLLAAIGLRRYVLPIFAALVLIGVLNALPMHFGQLPDHGLLTRVPLWRAFNRGMNIQYNHLFLLGMVLYESRRRGWKASDFALIGLCLLNDVLLTGWLQFTVVTGLFALAWVAVQTPVLSRPPRVLLYLGTISYALYLLHQNIGYVLIGHLYHYGLGPIAAIGVALAAALVYASAFTFGFERPVNRLIRQWWKKRTARPLPKPVTVGAGL
jgi:peptidoglycan/LPS O-acetylase OafA/YrhL